MAARDPGLVSSRHDIPVSGAGRDAVCVLTRSIVEDHAVLDWRFPDPVLVGCMRRIRVAERNSKQHFHRWIDTEHLP